MKSCERLGLVRATVQGTLKVLRCKDCLRGVVQELHWQRNSEMNGQTNRTDIQEQAQDCIVLGSVPAMFSGILRGLRGAVGTLQVLGVAGGLARVWRGFSGTRCVWKTCWWRC